MLSPSLVLPNPNGMHARPAARLVTEAKRFRAEVTVIAGERQARATSVAELMALDLTGGDTLALRAQGVEAGVAVEALQRLIESGLGEDVRQGEVISERRFVSDDEGVIGGVAASPGLVVGRAVVQRRDVPEYVATADDADLEKRRIERSMGRAERQLGAERETLRSSGQTAHAEIFGAQAELLRDERLRQATLSHVERGASAAAAWSQAIDAQASELARLKNPLLKQRAADVRDVGERVLYDLLGKPRPVLALTSDSVLVIEELSPSMAARLEPGKIGGIVTALGGAASHAAIIARSLGVPYVAGVGGALKRLTQGRTVIVDGHRGSVCVDPDAGVLQQAERAIEERGVAQAAELERAHQPATTRDGRTLEVAANIGNSRDAELATQKGCDAVGLLRSEFLFLGRREAPSEQEQRDEIERIAKTLGPRRSLVVRTLDVGGDKPLEYLPLPEEENPFLGVRGLRLSLRRPELFQSQLRAVVAAAAHTKLHVMFPMVAQLEEFQRARDELREQAERAGVAGAVSVGIMVEVPSAALNANWLAPEVDFFSIGTNDLTQYALAMDRGHSELSEQADACDPAVLKLMRMTVDAARAEGKWVGVCGGLAAEPVATPLLVGLGVDELSVPAPVIPELKARIRELEHAECVAVAEGALALPSAATVRALLRDFQRSR